MGEEQLLTEEEIDALTDDLTDYAVFWHLFDAGVSDEALCQPMIVLRLAVLAERRVQEIEGFAAMKELQRWR